MVKKTITLTLTSTELSYLRSQIQKGKTGKYVSTLVRDDLLHRAYLHEKTDTDIQKLVKDWSVLDTEGWPD